jgi:GNAT superfamily N-acetyltransferase
MDLIFQPVVNDRDFLDALSIRNEYYWFDPVSEEEARQVDEAAPPAVLWRRFLARDASGRAVARGMVRHLPWAEDSVFYIELSFREGEANSSRWHGCLDELERQAAEWGGRTLTTWLRDDHPDMIDCQRMRGYTETLRQPMSQLDVSQFDFTPYRSAVARLQEDGIEFLTLEEYIEREPDDWERRHWRLVMDLFRDVPVATPQREEPFEQFATYLRLPSFTPATRYLAVHEGRTVGLSEFTVSKLAPAHAETGLTGVRREYRRRGLATALKAVALARAQLRGVETMWTNNEENNPMFALNLKLGFQTAWNYIVMTRELPAPAASVPELAR